MLQGSVGVFLDCSKVVNQHTELEHTPKKPENQEAISWDSFDNWRANGGWPIGCAISGVRCNFLGIVSRGWFQPIWKICTSKWESSPRFGVKIKNIWNHHPVLFLGFKKNGITSEPWKNPWVIGSTGFFLELFDFPTKLVNLMRSLNLPNKSNLPVLAPGKIDDSPTSHVCIWATPKTPLTFHFPDWLIGILIMAYEKIPL